MRKVTSALRADVRESGQFLQTPRPNPLPEDGERGRVRRLSPSSQRRIGPRAKLASFTPSKYLTADWCSTDSLLRSPKSRNVCAWSNSYRTARLLVGRLQSIDRDGLAVRGIR